MGWTVSEAAVAHVGVGVRLKHPSVTGLIPDGVGIVREVSVPTRSVLVEFGPGDIHRIDVSALVVAGETDATLLPPLDAATEIFDRIDHLAGLPSFASQVDRVLEDLRSMLMEKNAAYGNSALEPIRCFSRADAHEQLKVRIDDKLSRLMRGHEFADDDTVKDLAGYLVLYLIARETNDG